MRQLTLFVFFYLCNGILCQAEEIKIGEPVQINGMSIGAVYLQAVLMSPPHLHSDANPDIHLEADIKSITEKITGFPIDSWIPYLGIHYEITQLNSNWHKSGDFIPMLANDGPHYGANVQLNGAAKYHVKYTIKSPQHQGFHRHIDKETGVKNWWENFTVEWDFVYLGVGKKGGY